MNQGFERMHNFHSMRLHKKAFRAIVQTNIESLTEDFKNIGAAQLQFIY